MHFQLASLSAFLLFSATTLALPTDGTLAKREECTFTAYSGSYCDGEAGDVDEIPGDRCILAEGRHSFWLGEGCTGTTDVKFYTGDGCPGDSFIDYQYYEPGCYAVNTGAHWGSSLVSVSY